VQSTIKRTGGYAYRTNPTTTGTGYITIGTLGLNGGVNTFSGVGTLYFSFYIRFDTLPAANEEEIIQFRTSTAGSLKSAITVTSAGILKIYDQANALVQTGATAFSTGFWYRISGSIATGTTAAYAAKIDGVSELSGTMDTTVTNHGAVRFGKATNRNGQSVDYYYDDIYLDNAAEPPAGGIEIMLPNATGNYTAWTDAAGTAPTNVAEVPHDGDTSYISGSTAGDIETEALESGASAGITGTVRVVKSMAFVRDEGGSPNFRIRLRSGSTDNDTSANTNPGTSYLYRGKLYDTDPATAAAWVLSALDSIEVGPRIASSAAGRCTFVGAEVYFTPSGGYTIAAAQGSYALNGQTAGLLAARKLVSAQGAYAYTGQDAGLRAARLLTGAQGAFSWKDGEGWGLFVGRKVAAAQGSFSLNGQVAAFLYNRLLSGAYGPFSLNGQDAGLSYSGAPLAVPDGPAPQTLADTLQSIVDQLVADVHAALSVPNDRTALERPRKPIHDPYVVVQLAERVSRDPHARVMDERFEFDITVRLNYPRDRPILIFKAEQAQAVGNQIKPPAAVVSEKSMAVPSAYAGVCSAWWISAVDFSEQGEPGEGRCEFSLRFVAIVHTTE